MAKQPATTSSTEEEDLPLTSINDKLIELPDESVVNVDVSDNPDLAATSEDDKEPTEIRTTEPDGDKETLEALRQRIADNAKESQERIRRAEETAANERRQRLATEQSAREREQSAQEETAQRELHLITQNLEAAVGQQESLETELARLNEAGEFKEAAKVQGRLAKVAASVDRLEAEKASYEANIGQRRPPTHEGAVGPEREAAPVPATRSEAFEQWLSKMDPPAANWIRAHPECAPPELGGSRQSHAKMMAGHYAAEASGIELNSPDYFKTIEEHTGHRKQATTAQTQLRQPARRPIPSARPSNEAPGGPVQSGRRQVRLNKEQQEAALLSFPHLKPQEALAQYARNLVELEAEGKMGRLSH